RRMAQAPTARNPVKRGSNSTARVVGDPPSTAGLNRGGKGPSTGLQEPGGAAAHPTARVVGDPPSTAGRHRDGNGPSTGLQKPGGDATVSIFAAYSALALVPNPRPGLQNTS